MLEIHVTISCPDLLVAAQLLRGAQNNPQVENTASAKPAPEPAPTVNPLPAPSAPVSIQTAPPVNQSVPLAGAPTFTLEQICKAGADLINRNPNALPQVNGLLAQYGVQTVTDLKPEHFGTVATALRGLGAKI